MWSGSDGCNTSWGKFSSRRTPLAANNGSLCFWSVTSAASLSSCVDGDSLNASSRFPGRWGVRVVYRSGRLLSTETSLLAPTRDPTTSGSCRDSLPEGYSVCQRCFTWPQNTLHSSALLSQESLFSSSSSRLPSHTPRLQSLAHSSPMSRPIEWLQTAPCLMAVV